MSKAADRRRWLGRTALFVLVGAVHLGVFAWIGLRAPLSRMRPMDPPIVEAYLMPPTPPRPRLPRLDLTPQAIAPYRPRLVLPVAPLEVEPIPAPLEAMTAGPDVVLRPALLPQEWDGARDALRTSPIGCGERDRVGLTRAERAVCDEKWGVAPVKPMPLGIDREKTAEFDRAADAKAERRREREGPIRDPMPTCTGAMSNFGVSCTR